MSSGYGSYNPYGTMGSRGAYDAYRHRSDIGQLISEYFVMNVVLQARAWASADA